MKPMVRFVAGLALVVVAAPCPAPACSLCQSAQQTQTFRETAADVRMVLYGHVTGSRLNPDGLTGTSQFRIDLVLKSDPWLGQRRTAELRRFLPVPDPRNPPGFLVFCTVAGNALDPTAGVPVRSAATAEYLRGALQQTSRPRAEALLYYSRYLEHPEPEIAADAFLEFAKAGDADIGAVGPKLSAEKLRGWLKDPKTPEERLGLYALLLGACGGNADADYLRARVGAPDDRTLKSLDGFLAGVIQLRGQEGWDLALATLRDEKKPFQVRYAALRTLRFYHGWKPAEARLQILRGLTAVVAQGDLADVAVEDLRRWQRWELTREVLAQYGKPSHDAPLMRQAIVRYALSCPRPEAAAFVAERRRLEPQLVREVEVALRNDKAGAR